MKLTTIFIVAIVFICVIYDIYAYSVVGSQASISQIIYHASYREPGGAIIPLLFGILMGHLFFNQ